MIAGVFTMVLSHHTSTFIAILAVNGYNWLRKFKSARATVAFDTNVAGLFKMVLSHHGGEK